MIKKIVFLVTGIIVIELILVSLYMLVTKGDVNQPVQPLTSTHQAFSIVHNDDELCADSIWIPVKSLNEAVVKQYNDTTYLIDFGNYYILVKEKPKL